MRRVPIRNRALVVGGGIAGIEAALQMADAGFEVVLVEREPSIGGHMASFDKTFPTLDCAACILTPKMVSVGQHPEHPADDLGRGRRGRGLHRQLQGHASARKARYVDVDEVQQLRHLLRGLPVPALPGAAADDPRRAGLQEGTPRVARAGATSTWHRVSRAGPCRAEEG